MADLLPAPTGGSGGPPHGMTSQFRGVTFSKKSAKWQVRRLLGPARPKDAAFPASHTPHI